jgi:hypothetical protein
MENSNFQIEDENQKQNKTINIRPSIVSTAPTHLSPPPVVHNIVRKNTRALSIAYDPFKSYNQSQKIISGSRINKDYLISAVGVLRILLIVS